nr:MAG TPA: hypothetical protein [Caudoviricetes sp.]
MLELLRFIIIYLVVLSVVRFGIRIIKTWRANHGRKKD